MNEVISDVVVAIREYESGKRFSDAGRRGVNFVLSEIRLKQQQRETLDRLLTNAVQSMTRSHG